MELITLIIAFVGIGLELALGPFALWMIHRYLAVPVHHSYEWVCVHVWVCVGIHVWVCLHTSMCVGVILVQGTMQYSTGYNAVQYRVQCSTVQGTMQYSTEPMMSQPTVRHLEKHKFN